MQSVPYSPLQKRMSMLAAMSWLAYLVISAYLLYRTEVPEPSGSGSCEFTCNDLQTSRFEEKPIIRQQERMHKEPLPQDTEKTVVYTDTLRTDTPDIEPSFIACGLVDENIRFINLSEVQEQVLAEIPRRWMRRNDSVEVEVWVSKKGSVDSIRYPVRYPKRIVRILEEKLPLLRAVPEIRNQRPVAKWVGVHLQ